MSETTPVIEGLFDERGLIGGACAGCGQRHFPRAGYCPWCGVAGPTSVRLATEGTLWSWTAIGTAPPGYEGPVPFGFGIVELTADELRVVTLVTESDPARLRVGAPMRFRTVPIRDPDTDPDRAGDADRDPAGDADPDGAGDADPDGETGSDGDRPLGGGGAVMSWAFAPVAS